MIYIIWEFKVSLRHRAEFETAYRGDGAWSQLFARDPDYVKTVFVKNAEGDFGKYLTIDVWKSREAFSEFKDHFTDEYSQLDKRCEALTESERLIGIFEERA